MQANKAISRRYFYQVRNGMNEAAAYEILDKDFVFTMKSWILTSNSFWPSP